MHPSASTQIESKLSARHLSFTFEPNLRIDQIRDVEGNQVRLSKHRAPKEMVERYAEQMKGGAIFPAIVVNDRYEIVDGNTRWMAVRRNRKDDDPRVRVREPLGPGSPISVGRAQPVARPLDDRGGAPRLRHGCR